MKRLIGITILGAALGAQPAASQPAGEGPRDGRHRDRAIVEHLDLTQEQQDQWKALRERHRDDVKALREEGRGLREKLRESLEADAPAVVVGEAAKAAHAHRQRVEQAREAFEGQLKSVLTPEQREKYEAFQAVCETGRQGRGARGHRRDRAQPPVEG